MKNVLWLFSVSPPAVLHSCAVSPAEPDEWLSSVGERCPGREAAAAPPGSTGQEVRGARGPQPLPRAEAEFHLDAVDEGRLQEQVKYSSLLSSVVNFQVGRTKWIALYPIMQSVTEEERV